MSHDLFFFTNVIFPGSGVSWQSAALPSSFVAGERVYTWYTIKPPRSACVLAQYILPVFLYWQHVLLRAPVDCNSQYMLLRLIVAEVMCIPQSAIPYNDSFYDGGSTYPLKCFRNDVGIPSMRPKMTSFCTWVMGFFIGMQSDFC